MKPRKSVLAPLLVFIFALLMLSAVYMTVDTVRNSQTSKSERDNVSSREKSPYARVFNEILNESDALHGDTEKLVYGPYMWNALDDSPHNCTITKNLTSLRAVGDRIYTLYKNLSLNMTQKRDLIGIILLTDLDMDISFTLGKISYLVQSRYISPDVEVEACISLHRLENFEKYREKALAMYGKPCFSYEYYRNLSLKIRKFITTSYRLRSTNRTWDVEVRRFLEKSVEILASNETLLKRNLDENYSPRKAAQLLENFARQVRADPYMNVLWGSSLNYLVYLRNSDLMKSGASPVQIDEHYLEVFWAWYHMFAPECG